MLKSLWSDEGGAILSAELILLMTILVIALIVGLKTLQMAITTELADVAAAIGSLNQSYAFSGSQTCGGGHAANTMGSSYQDNMDTCDSGPVQGAANSQGVVVSGINPLPENTVPTL